NDVSREHLGGWIGGAMCHDAPGVGTGQARGRESQSTRTSAASRWFGAGRGAAGADVARATARGTRQTSRGTAAADGATPRASPQNDTRRAGRAEPSLRAISASAGGP